MIGWQYVSELAPDVPARLFRQLLNSASSIVRAKLEAESPHLKHEIGGLVTELAARIETQAAVLSPKYAAAHVLVESLNQAGKLNTEKLEAFASADRYEDTVAALALMSGMPIDVVEHKLNDGVCRVLADPGQGNRAVLDHNQGRSVDARGQASALRGR